MDDLFDLKSLAASNAEFEDCNANQLFDFLTIDTEASSKSKKQIKQTFQTDAQRQASLPDQIFDYIYTAQCHHLFSLVWYDNLTYIVKENGSTKSLSVLCCNSSGY